MLAPIMDNPVEIFISYNHADKELLYILTQYLDRLSEHGFIEYWYDEKIFLAGELWQQEIEKRLNSSRIILLCLSPEYLASGVANREMSIAIKRHVSREAAVVPILFHSIKLSEIPLSKLQILPSNEVPLNNWKDLNAAFDDVMRGIELSIRREINDSYQRYFLSERHGDFYSEHDLSHATMSDVSHLDTIPDVSHLESPVSERRYLDRLKLSEGYAVARIKDNEDDDVLHLSKEYVIQVSVQRNLPKGFKAVGITLDTARESISLVIVVHAEDMSILPDWCQSYDFRLTNEPSLIEFTIIPRSVGAKRIYVEFFHERHWLAKIQFEVLVVERPQQAIPSSER